ncbi:MAG TPA: hypothetical protein VHP99_08135, partial [Pyrinomonadaceae bacterium]|nr:hypothetical protein [Pyrinomonadaceae bacterium]
FHFAPGLEIEARPDGIVAACDKINGATLLLVSLAERSVPELEPGFVSTDYGAKQASVIACWSERASVPLLKRWAIIPVRVGEDGASSGEIIARLRADRRP